MLTRDALMRRTNENDGDVPHHLFPPGVCLVRG